MPNLLILYAIFFLIYFYIGLKYCYISNNVLFRKNIKLNNFLVCEYKYKMTLK